MLLLDVLVSLSLGLLTPITALCVLPLFPGYVAYLSKSKGKSPVLIGLLMVLGVITFMGVLGLLFTTFLSASLTNVVSIVSPIAFLILLIIGILMIFPIHLNIPHFKLPVMKQSLFGAYLTGLFFGAIVLPCNPGFIATFFSRAFLFSSPVSSLLNFFAFGLGMGLPLLLLSLVSVAFGQKSIRFFGKYQRVIMITAGSIMVVVSFYYLFFVFEVWRLII